MRSLSWPGTRGGRRHSVPGRAAGWGGGWPEEDAQRGPAAWVPAAPRLSCEARGFASADPSLGTQFLIPPLSAPETWFPQSGSWGIVFTVLCHRSELGAPTPNPWLRTTFPSRRRGDRQLAQPTGRENFSSRKLESQWQEVLGGVFRRLAWGAPGPTCVSTVLSRTPCSDSGRDAPGVAGRARLGGGGVSFPLRPRLGPGGPVSGSERGDSGRSRTLPRSAEGAARLPPRRRRLCRVPALALRSPRVP